METFALLIAGTRTYCNYEQFKYVVDFMLQKQAEKRQILIVSGGCDGADMLAERYANEHGYGIIIVTADWNKYGKAAGYRRNDEMHRKVSKYEHRGCLCFWDGASRGTSHHFELAPKYGTRLVVFNYTENKIQEV